MQNVYAVTHAQSVHHVENLGGGWYDTSLTEKGITQAKKLGAYLFEQIQTPGIPIYSSDLKRTAETAGWIAKVFGSDIIFDERLREMNLGDAGGKPEDWRQANMNRMPVDGNRLDHRMFQGSESRRDIACRISECISEITSSNDENIIIVSHGHALSYIIMSWLKVPVENMDSMHFRAAPATVTLLHEDDIYANRNIYYLSREIK